MTEPKRSQPIPKQRILVIDDEAVVCLSCVRILTPQGYQVDIHQQPKEGLKAALTGNYDLILLDIIMPEMDGIELLKQIKSSGVLCEVVIITGYSTVQTAVEAMKHGAADYVSKPFTPDELRMVVAKVIERSTLMRECAALREQLATVQEFEGMVGTSRAMEQLFALIKRVAPTQGTVLITGESGTGKELVARAIHRLSGRSAKPFLACDCTSLAPTLLESELFGHVKGSFTGAIAAKKGLFEIAHQGTLFLDEVSNLSPEIQSKLLRVLETRQVKKVGDTASFEVDIRLIAATNQDLKELVEYGAFREDLYYRLDVVPVHVPPLRDRIGDIPRLAHTFLERFRQNNPVKVQGFTPEAMGCLERYHWPGNVRQLRNVVERVAILSDAERVEPHHLPESIHLATGSPLLAPLPRTWDEFKEFKKQVRDAAIEDIERRFLVEALCRTQHNVTKAAEEVGMQRTNFHALMRKHGLTSEDE